MRKWFKWLIGLGSMILTLGLVFIMIIVASFTMLFGGGNSTSVPEGVGFVDLPMLCDRYIVTTDFIDDEYYQEFERYHYAVDMVGYLEGEKDEVPVVTLYDGIVWTIFTNEEFDTGYGVVMKYEEMDLYVLYCHFAFPPEVEIGQELYAGDILGIQGTTGLSTGIHLHIAFYEGAYNNDNKVDPRDYIELAEKGVWTDVAFSDNENEET